MRRYLLLLCLFVSSPAFAGSFVATGTVEAISNGGLEGHTLRAYLRLAGEDPLAQCEGGYAYVSERDPDYASLRDLVVGQYFAGAGAKIEIEQNDARWCHIVSVEAK